MTYEPTWESLDQRATPTWFDEAKFGIFIHWGLYSVPAWAPVGRGGESYAEWYWKHMNNPNHPTYRHHRDVYGEKFVYQDFVHLFRAELFEPERWSDLFKMSGAKYVVLTSKHHDGFCLWPSAQSWNWNSVDVGPHRDLCGELSKAVKDSGLKMGFYYSLYEWYNPLYLDDFEKYVANHMIPQMKDLVLRYEPSLLWTDGEWERPSQDWRSTEFLAWLFNESPVKDEVAVNDRWGKETRSTHGGFYTTEYGQVHLGADLKLGEKHKWEECRGIGYSFGYNRNEHLEDYMTERDCIHLLVDTVSKGGNLLLDIGPTADGRIPVIMQERLVQIGNWLSVNGEAIYGTQPWRQSDDDAIRYTAKGSTLYAIWLKWPGRRFVLRGVRPSKDTTVSMPGLELAMKWQPSDNGMIVEVPDVSPDHLPSQHAYVFKLSNMQEGVQ